MPHGYIITCTLLTGDIHFCRFLFVCFDFMLWFQIVPRTTHRQPSVDADTPVVVKGPCEIDLYTDVLRIMKNSSVLIGGVLDDSSSSCLSSRVGWSCHLHQTWQTMLTTMPDSEGFEDKHPSNASHWHIIICLHFWNYHVTKTGELHVPLCIKLQYFPHSLKLIQLKFSPKIVLNTHPVLANSWQISLQNIRMFCFSWRLENIQVYANSVKWAENLQFLQIRQLTPRTSVSLSVCANRQKVHH